MRNDGGKCALRWGVWRPRAPGGKSGSRCDNLESYHQLPCHQIQNELIDLLSSKVISIMVSDIKLAKYFSIILDCTSDVSHTKQLSVVIRIVSLKEEPHIKEHFMAGLEADESTDQHLASLILKR